MIGFAPQAPTANPCDGADREAEQQRQDDRGGEAEAERVEEDHRGDRGGLAEGEREEVAAEDDDRQPDGDDPDERRGGEDRLHVAHGQEAGGREGSVDRHRREDRDPDGKRDVGDPERPALDADAGHHGAHGAAPRARGMARRHVGEDRGRRRLGPWHDRDDAAVEDRDDDVCEVEHLVELGGREDHGRAAAGRLANEVVDVGAPADVDAARRLVEGEQRGALELERAAEQHLLLVAAAEAGGRRAEPVDGDTRHGRELPRRTLDPAPQQNAEPAQPAEPRDRQVALDRLAEEEPLALPVVRDVEHARGGGTPRRVQQNLSSPGPRPSRRRSARARRARGGSCSCPTRPGRRGP